MSGARPGWLAYLLVAALAATALGRPVLPVDEGHPDLVVQAGGGPHGRIGGAVPRRPPLAGAGAGSCGEATGAAPVTAFTG